MVCDQTFFKANFCMFPRWNMHCIRIHPTSLRATAITYLNDSGFEARHIMFMSNHKNESSLISYNRFMSKYLSKTLSSMKSTSRSPTPRVQNENTALLPIPVSANVNMPLPIPQNVELTSNVVYTQEINPNAGFLKTILPSVIALSILQSDNMADWYKLTA